MGGTRYIVAGSFIDGSGAAIRRNVFLQVTDTIITAIGSAAEARPFTAKDMVTLDRVSDPRVSPDGRYFGQGRRSRATDQKGGGCINSRHLVDEFLDAGFDSGVLISFYHALVIALAGLMNDSELLFHILEQGKRLEDK